MGALRQDLRYGARMLLRRPGFTLVTVLTLALGVGANTAIFSVVNAVLLRPLPYRDAGRVVTLWQTDAQTGARDGGAAPGNFADWRDRAQSFESLAAAVPFSHSLTGDGDPESFRSWQVTEGFFEILGTGALAGRTFTAEDYRPGAERVIIIGQGLWQRRFGADRGIVGRAIHLSGQPHTVVGVMPAEFDFPPGRELWVPRVLTEQDRRVRGSGYIKVVGRLRDGVTAAQAQSEMDAVAAHISAEQAGTETGVGVAVVPLPEQLTGDVRPALLVLLGAVGLVLLIACANVANLMLARAAEREKEFAIRAAMGASRWRVMRQLLTESMTLALAGGAGGLLLATWLVDALLALGPAGLPRAAEVAFDLRVLAFAVGISAFTALLFGIAPAVQLSRPDLIKPLKEGGRTSGGGSRHRLRDALVVVEVALSLVLLVGAGLLMHSFVRLLRVDPGFSAEKALTLEAHVWGLQRTPEKRAAFFNETLSRIAALPGVEAAGAVSALPFHENSIDINTTFNVEGRPAPPAGQEPVAYATIATPDYFRAMGIPTRRGRPFSRFDDAGSAPVVLINETMARQHFPGEDPVGRKIAVGFNGAPKTREVIGVVGDVRHTGLDSEPRAELFFPHPQEPYGSMTYVVRTAPDPSALLASVKQEVWAVSRHQPFSSVATVEQLVSRSTAQRRFNLLLLGSFAALALALAGVGIYGLVSFTTTQRTHEIGVRMALGARPADIFLLVIGRGLLLALCGVAVGLVGALALTRLLAGLLYGVSPTDAPTYAAVSLLLALVAAAASYLPARRATRVDPLVALRYE